MVANRFLKLPNLHVLIKQNSPSLPRNLALGLLVNCQLVFSRKLNLLYFLYSAIQRCFPVHLIKQNYLLKTLLRTLILMTSIFLTVFPSRTNLKLHNISAIPKVVKKVVTNLYSSRVFGLDCMAVVALKN